jgi:hypothetical protein
MNSVHRPLCFASIAALSACTGAIGPGAGPLPDGGGVTGAAGISGAAGGGGAGAGTVGPGGGTGGSMGGVTASVAAVGAGRLRRLTEAQLAHSLDDVIGAVQLGDTQLDERLGDDNFFAVAASYFSISAGATSAYHDALESALTALFADGTRRAALFSDCTPASANDVGCYTRLISHLGHHAWRRELTASEVSRYVGVATGAASTLRDPAAGMLFALLGLLQSPNFLFRVEVGAPSGELGGRYKYTGPELASRLSYWIWSSTPDAMLLSLGESGQLDGPAGIKQAIAYLLQSDRARAGISDYAYQLFKLDEVVERSKDMEPRYTDTVRRAMAGEVQMIWQRTLQPDADALDLFTTNQGYANSELATLYGVPGVIGTTLVPVTYPAGQRRVGILGTAAFLAEQAKATDTSPTQRGLFVVEHLLCESIPPPPANVNTVIAAPDPRTGLTKRQILERHVTDPSCAACHSTFDPIGFAFEGFDWIGRYRTADPSTRPVDTAGDIPGIGKWADEPELAALLKGLPRVRSCLIQNLYSFIQGHPPKDGDAFDSSVLEGWGKSFEEGGHRLARLFAEIATSDGFRYVSPAPVDTTTAGH